ncbi:TetR/AcrR family transcriptional regulator, partial [Acinetobacter baumannii]|nr:TetR family transcriptional regulator [Acinetobacter baumannii]
YSQLRILKFGASFNDAKLFLYMIEGAIIQCLDKNDAHEGNKALDYFLLKIGLV